MVNDKDVNSTDDLHQNNSQSLADKLDKNPANQEAPEKKIQNVCHSSWQIKANQIKQAGSKWNCQWIWNACLPIHQPAPNKNGDIIEISSN